MDDKPQYPDHDFPHPGYLLIPSGYMQLVASGEKSWCDYFEVSENDLISLPVEKTQGSDEQCSLPVENQPVQAQASPSGRETTFSGSPSEDSSTGSNQQANDSTPTTCITFATTITTSSTITICGKDGPSIVTESVCSLRTDSEAKNTSKSVSGGTQPSDSTESSSSVFLSDKLGRQHLKCPHTGPATVVLRSSKFHSSSIQVHAKPLLEVVNSQGKTIVFAIVDGGPDWNTGAIANALFFMRLWRDCNLDMLVCSSFAARFSAYNPIEHLWSPLSKHLTSVRLPAVDGEDEHAPCRIGGLSTEEKRSKEARVFDNAIQEVCRVHWKDASFNSFPVVAVPVPCISESGHYSDYAEMYSLMKGPLRNIAKQPTLIKELNFMVKHLDRRRNELIFRKCDDPLCSHCVSNPVHATAAFEFLRRRNFCVSEPEKSKNHPEHYSTFLEMCEKEPDDLQNNIDKEMPSVKNKQLGRCKICPAYTFLSETERKRHMSIFHPNKSRSARSQQDAQQFYCKYKECGLSFPSKYRLSVHRRYAGHCRKRTSSCSTVAKKHCS